MTDALPTHARVVVVGGGIAGCSVAYHLAKLGWRDVVLLERRDVSCGTTWHAAGLVGQLRATHNLTRLAKYGADLYERLEAETGQATGFRRPGSVSVARTRERMIELKRLLRGSSSASCFRSCRSGATAAATAGSGSSIDRYAAESRGNRERLPGPLRRNRGIDVQILSARDEARLGGQGAPEPLRRKLRARPGGRRAGSPISGPAL